MNFLLYYILRKLFVKLDFSDKEISLEKGLLLKRAAILPLSSIVRVTVRRTLVMRVFRAKEITLFTLGGKLTFYLRRNENPTFLPEPPSTAFKPRFRDVMFGAFIDTRALGGLFVFTAVLRRFSAIFGGEYFDRLISALVKTAEELEKALDFFRITVPRIAVTLGVFALGSWIFAYIRKLLRLSRFRITRKNGLLFVKSGAVTLYEHTLVPNYAAAVYCDALTTVISERAPLYLRGVMICPCVKRKHLPHVLKRLCGLKVPQKKLASPKRAFFGHVAAPLSWFGAFSALLAAAHFSDRPAMLLKTVLYCGIAVSLYAAALYLLYMSRSGIAVGEECAAVSARRGLRLYTAVFSVGAVNRVKNSQSVFQKRSGLCNFKLYTADREKFTARQLPKIECLRRTPF